jgi:tRNA threonylcarbamoyladenosine biosynthesis protein TsaE
MHTILHRLTKSAEETQKVGQDFVQRLLPQSLVLLQGGLGAGKTVFVKGMAQGLGIRPEEVRSPTFALIHEYLHGKIPLYHMDFYRLDNWDEVINLGFMEYLEKEGIVVIEWGDKFLPFFLPPFWMVEIQVLGEEERDIMVQRWVE